MHAPHPLQEGPITALPDETDMEREGQAAAQTPQPTHSSARQTTSASTSANACKGAGSEEGPFMRTVPVACTVASMPDLPTTRMLREGENRTFPMIRQKPAALPSSIGLENAHSTE